MAEIERLAKDDEEKKANQASSDLNSQYDFSRFSSENGGLPFGSSRVDRVADSLPSLNIDSAAINKQSAEHWSFNNSSEMLDRILSGSSLFTHENGSKKSAERVPSDRTGAVEDGKIPSKVILINTDNRSNSKSANDAKPSEAGKDSSVPKSDAGDSKNDSAEKKGPVKLPQEKFDTQDIKKAFQIAKENNLPVIVYKGANFCGNCPPVSHAIDKLADDIKKSPNTEAVVLKLNWEKAQEISKKDPELGKLIEEIMPLSGSSFPDVKVYNPNDTTKPLKDSNRYGGDAEFLKSLIKVGQDSFAQAQAEKPKEKSNDSKPEPGIRGNSDTKVEPKPIWTKPSDSSTNVFPKPVIDGLTDRSSVSRSSDTQHQGPSSLPDLSLSTVDSKAVKLDDGTYKRDDQGRVTETISADGKTKRSFKYEDAANPNRITSETINDKTTYKFIGTCKVNNQPHKIDGKEDNSYSIYEDGKLVGNWSGVRDISPNGVYAFKDDKMQNIEYRDASGQKLSDEERQHRDQGGIWPSEFQVATDNGSKLHAKLNGNRLESLTETKSENGQEKQIAWSRKGDLWTSNESPARERKNLTVDKQGNIRYDSVDGAIKHELLRDGNRTETNRDGIRTTFNKSEQLSEVRQANGDTKTLNYDGTSLVSINEKIAGTEKQWKRTAGTDDWSDGQKTETRRDIETRPDGSIRYKNADGQAVTEASDQARITSDDQNRPIKVEYPSGSTRSFDYTNGQLNSFTDKLIVAGKEQTSTWTRNGATGEFTSPGANGTTKSRSDINVSANGDYSYKSSDGKDHKNRAYDLERQARGEIIVGSESVQEARDNFIELARERGLKAERYEKYLNQLDATSKNYGSTPAQIGKALDSLSSILEADKGKYHSRAELDNLVETALHNIAYPADIDQGYHPTCNVTTTEIFAAAKHPDKYAELLKQVALTGEYMTSLGKAVHPPENALKPGRDEKNYNPDETNPQINKRNFASQIYQMTTINGVYELGIHSSEKDGKDSGTRYVMGEVRSKKIPNGSVDLGEDLLVDKNGKMMTRKNGESIDGPEFIQDDNVTAAKMVTGETMPYLEAPYSLQGETKKHYDLPTSERLQKAKAEGKFPLGVSTMDGNHVQTIHDVVVDSKGSTWVLLDNQHGKAKDGWVPLSDLHKTQSSDLELEPKRRPSERPQ